MSKVYVSAITKEHHLLLIQHYESLLRETEVLLASGDKSTFTAFRDEILRDQIARSKYELGLLELREQVAEAFNGPIEDTNK